MEITDKENIRIMIFVLYYPALISDEQDLRFLSSKAQNIYILLRIGP